MRGGVKGSHGRVVRGSTCPPVCGVKVMRLLVMSVDHSPEELYDQVPFVVELRRQLAGEDREDYWLGTVVVPLEWWVDGEECAVRHVVLAARHAGQCIEPGVRELAVNIAFVTDQTLLEEARLDMAKCRFVAIGVCRDFEVVS